MSGQYTIRQFAKLAGVTVKTLHHYDRLGLLRPKRTAAGYRAYTGNDLERLEQILALKFLGLPLREIAQLLAQTPLVLPDALRAQRRALEEKRAQLGRAIRAIDALERATETDKTADPVLLKKVIEVIDMQDAIEAMKKYYRSEKEWEKRKRYYEEGPGPEWRQLYRDAAMLLGEDPASDPVQALADRWLELTLRAANGDLNLLQDSQRAWMDRENWPGAMKARVAAFQLEEVTSLIHQAALSARKKYFSPSAWQKVVAMREEAASSGTSNAWQDWVDLFRDAEAALDADPQSEGGRSIAQRWMAVLDSESQGDPRVKDGLLRWWADRLNWSQCVRWRAEGLTFVKGERFDQIARWIDMAAYREGATSFCVNSITN